MTPQDFQIMSKLVRERSGLVLKKTKRIYWRAG